MSSSLPFTVQDDIEQKEKYAASSQQQKRYSCNSRRVRTWSLIILVTLCTLGLVTYMGKYNTTSEISATVNTMIGDDIVLPKEEPQTLKEEISGLVNDNQLIIFSKTYCPYSLRAKRILSLYKFKFTLPVIEVDLRDDDYAVKMTLKEISGRETFPNIFLNGKSLGGFDNLEELFETGQLDILFQDLLLEKRKTQ